MALPTISMQARAVADPEMRFTQSGMAVCKIRCVASARKFNEQTKEWEDGDKFWITVTAFKKLAENVAESVVKGTLINVAGRIKTDEWTTKDTQEKRSAPSIVADTIGVALDFDAAKVMKAERQGGGDPASPADDPWATTPGGEEPPF